MARNMLSEILRLVRNRKSIFSSARESPFSSRPSNQRRCPRGNRMNHERIARPANRWVRAFSLLSVSRVKWKFIDFSPTKLFTIQNRFACLPPSPRFDSPASLTLSATAFYMPSTHGLKLNATRLITLDRMKLFSSLNVFPRSGTAFAGAQQKHNSQRPLSVSRNTRCVRTLRHTADAFRRVFSLRGKVFLDFSLESSREERKSFEGNFLWFVFVYKLIWLEDEILCKSSVS